MAALDPSGGVRVRFAPSPTGYLHVGGVRTAIFNWLFARRHGGTFILRIDDTDLQRNREEAIRVILDGLRWVGLDWDEGPDRDGPRGPYFQSQRLEKYRAAAEKLERTGRAVWMKKERQGELPAWKIEKLKKAGRWDEDLARAEEDPRPALYFRLHAGEPAPIAFHDAVWGDYSVPPELLPDLVLLRADRSPTYNFASTVDDVELGITHIIRGEDHLANTAKQIPLFQALGAPMPQFAHLPMIHNEKGEKISKRRDPVAITLYQAAGVLPEALFNFLALLGWSPGDNRELLNKTELAAAFSLDRIKKTPAQFALRRKSDPPPPEAAEEQRIRWLSDCLPGAKLEWMNGEYLKRLPPAELLARARPFLEAVGCAEEDRPREWLEQLMLLGRERARTLAQLAESVRLFFRAPEVFDPKAAAQWWRGENGAGLARLAQLRGLLAAHADWRAESLERALEEFVAASRCKLTAAAQPLRIALAGAAVSPPIHQVLALLGREETLRRVDRALAEK